MSFNLYSFYQELKTNGISFSYSGPLAQEGLEGISQTLRKKLEADEIEFSASQAIFSVFVEEVQNILNYSAERQTYQKSGELAAGVFVIGHDERGYFVLCGNKIYAKDCGFLAAKIEELRGLSKDELKTLFKQRRKMEPEPQSKGAGLGLIEIARRSGNPIEYSFEPIDDTFSFFSMRVIIGNNNRSDD